MAVTGILAYLSSLTTSIYSETLVEIISHHHNNDACYGNGKPLLSMVALCAGGLYYLVQAGASQKMILAGAL